jgi:hypothetical protein
MAKYKHHADTLIVLKDLDNRLTQLIEASLTSNADFVETEVRALQSARSLVEQCTNHGHVFRGSSYVPDGLEPYFKTPSPNERLNV